MAQAFKEGRREIKNKFTPQLSNIVETVPDYDFAVQHSWLFAQWQFKPSRLCLQSFSLTRNRYAHY
jgi:hypothetical protein